MASSSRGTPALTSRGRGRVGVQPGERGARAGVGLERHPAAQHLVEHDAEAVEVGAAVDRLGLDLLGRQVLGGAEERPLLGEVGRLGGLGDAEVADLHPAVLGQQDVGGLDVAVDEAGGVGDRQRAGDLGGDVGGDPRVDLAVVEPGAQGLAAHQLHDDGLDAVVAARVVDVDDRRVRQAGDGDGLVAEAGDERLVGREVLVQDLDRDGAPQHLVGAEPHLRHAAGRQQLVEPVARAQKRAGGDAGGLRRAGRGRRHCHGGPTVVNGCP